MSLSDQLTAFLVRSCRDTVLLPWDEMALDELVESPLPASASQLVRLAREANSRAMGDRTDLSLTTLRADRIRELLAVRWGVGTDHLDLAARDRGFSSPESAVASARPFYLLARYNERATRSASLV
ncbi:hypothetical protein ABZY09_45800 [Streptomyces sp. NPDC002928]|uniref:hypothetical protein n=1 Tax=Streptomyces sp. NPDC002928 TaxID=3154440 RepID=UPI0033BCEE42